MEDTKKTKRIITEKKTEFHKRYIKTPEFETVRKAVFERDHYRCVLCGRTENLVCHHSSYRHLGYHNQKEIDDCVTLCNLDHLNHHRGKYNLNWYSIDHPRNNDDLRDIEVDGQRILVRSNGEDFYDAETYKRLKITHMKDRDRYVIFTNTTHKYFYTHRLVAKAFPEICGAWFEGCEVHHKDRDHSNNRADNLKVMTVEEHRKEHKDETIKASRKISNVPVYQYTMSGNYVAKWESTAAAARALGLNRSAIGNSLCGISESSGDFIWKHFEEGEEIPLWVEPLESPVERCINKISKPISQYTKDGEFVRDWKNMCEASLELNGKVGGSINNCLRGRSKTAFGYIWKYKDK